MKIKKTDISSILPIIIKIIKAILEDINKSEKLRFCKLYISELTVFVKARMANLNDFSKPMLSNTKKVDKMNKLIKNEMNKRFNNRCNWGKEFKPDTEPQYEYTEPKIIVEELILPIPEDIKIFFETRRVYKPEMKYIDIIFKRRLMFLYN